MIDFVYNASTAISVEKSRRTFQLLFPSVNVEYPVSKIYDSRVWITVKIGDEYFLYAKLFPISIESVESDIGEALIMNADMMRSTYYLSSFEAKQNYKYKIINPQSYQAFRLSEIGLDQVQNFEVIENKSREFSFSTALPSFQFKGDLTSESDLNALVCSLVKKAKVDFSVADLKCNARNRNWDEYHCFAYNYLLAKELFREEMIREAVDTSQESLGVNLSVRCPNVDTNLRPVTPDSIKSRKFISPEVQTPYSLVATEKAESRHQEILKDVSEYFLSIGVTPLESSSVDLAVNLKSGIVFFEIKSSNPDNFVRQYEKALSQILQYDFELYKSGIKVLGKYLIIEKSAESSRERYVKDLFVYCGSGVLFYDNARNWPDRLPGIEELICEDD